MGGNGAGSWGRWLNQTARWAGCWFLGLFCWSLAAASHRVVLADFTCDDISYRSWEAAKQLTVLVQAVLSAQEGVQWVERKEFQKQEAELKLGLMGVASSSEAAKIGRMLEADWGLHTTIGSNEDGKRAVHIELVDLTRAETLGSTNLTMEVEPRSRLSATSGLAAKLAEPMASLLAGAASKTASAPAAFRIAVLPSPIADWVSGVATAMKESQALTQAGPVHLVDFRRAGRSIDEAELGLLGLAETRSNAWRQVADVYIWLAGPRPLAPDSGFAPRQPKEIHIWDGRSAPRSLRAAPPFTSLVAQVAEIRAQYRRDDTVPAEATDWRRTVAQEVMDSWVPRGRSSISGVGDLPDRPAWELAMSAMEICGFLDPANAAAREGYLRLRWGLYTPAGRPRDVFLFEARANEAWEQHVLRFGPSSLLAAMDESGDPACQMLRTGLDTYARFVGSGEDRPADMPAPILGRGRLAQLRALMRQVPLAMASPAAAPWVQRVRETVTAEPGLTEDEKKTFAQAAPAKVEPKRESQPEMITAARPGPPARPVRAGGPESRLHWPKAGALYSPEDKPWLDDGLAEYGLARVQLPGAKKVVFPPGYEVLGASDIQVVDGHLWGVSSCRVDRAERLDDGGGGGTLRQALVVENLLWEVTGTSYRARFWTNGLANLQPISICPEQGRLWVGVAPRADAGGELPTASPGSAVEATTGTVGGLVIRPSAGTVETITNTQPAVVSRFVWLGGKLHAVGQGVGVRDAASGQWTLLTGAPPVRAASPSGSWLVESGEQALFWFQGAPLSWLRDGKVAMIPQGKPQTVLPVGDGKGGFFLAEGGKLFHWDRELTNDFTDDYRAPLVIPRRVSSQGALMGRLALGPDVTNEEQAAMRVRLARRMEGELKHGRRLAPVSLMHVDKEWLWVVLSHPSGQVASAKFQLALLHWPSRRWVGIAEGPGRIDRLLVQGDNLWVAGTWYGQCSGVWRWPIAPWRAIPESQWQPVSLTSEERDRWEGKLSQEAKAIRALWRGDASLAWKRWGQVPVDDLGPEEIFLMTLACDEKGQAQGDRQRYYEDFLLREYPNTLGAMAVKQTRLRREVAADPIPKTDPPAVRAGKILRRYDTNGDGVLQADEIDLWLECEPPKLSALMAGPFGRTQRGFGTQIVTRLTGRSNGGVSQQQIETLLQDGSSQRPAGLRPSPNR